MGNSKSDRVITRSKLIEQRLLEMKLRGEKYPNTGSIVEYKHGDNYIIGEVIGYDIIKGELRALCVPADGQKRTKGDNMRAVKLSHVRSTDKSHSEIQIR